MSASGVSLYDFAIVPLIRNLESAITTLKKAKAYAAENGIPEADLVTARLIDDMFPYFTQIYQVRKAVTHALHRLRDGTCEPTDPERSEGITTFDECLAMLNASLDDIKSTGGRDSDIFADAQLAQPVKVEIIPPIKFECTKKQVLESMTLPNVAFHVTTAYGILRSKGVPVGKTEYLTPFVNDLVDMEEVTRAYAAKTMQKQQQE